MKKLYSKPEIAFENFAVSVAIAASCEITSFTDDALKFSDGTYAFTSKETSCGTWYDDEFTDSETHDSICYHVPHGFNVHNS